MQARRLLFGLASLALAVCVGADKKPMCAAEADFKEHQQCTGGQYLSRTGTLSYYDCGPKPGKVSLAPKGAICTRDSRKQACKFCEPGKFKSIAQDATHCDKSCDLCPLGLFSYSGHGHCEACDAGRAVPDSVSIPRTREHCAECPHGKYTAHTCQFNVNYGCWQAQQCLDCQVGKQDTGTGQNGCVDCGVGTSSGGGGSGCAPCPPGTGSATAGGVCSACTVGASDSNFPSATPGVCSVCLSGFEPDASRVSCVPCIVPFFSTDGVKCGECPNGEVSGYNGDFTRCEVCRDSAKPSRPQGSGLTVCVKCELGEWFDVETRLCALIPEVFLHIDAENQRTVVMLPSVEGNGAVSRQPDALEMYYVNERQPTDLIQAPPNHFINWRYQVESCDLEDLSYKYTFLDRCGPQTNLMELNWVKARRERKVIYLQGRSVSFTDEPIENIRSKGLPGKYFLIEKKGNEIPCQACDGLYYNTKCRANQGRAPDGCQECVLESACAPHEFLFHTLPQRCAHPRALTDTECRACQKTLSTGTDMHVIVLGCGKLPLPRWNGLSFSINAQKTESVCDYSDQNPQCQDQDGGLFKQTTDHLGFASKGPRFLTYCPPGYFINTQHVECDSSWDETWDIKCCQRCEACGSRQKKNSLWVQCSGSLTRDTQDGACTDTCSPGFYEKDEDGFTNCAQCRRSCA